METSKPRQLSANIS